MKKRIAFVVQRYGAEVNGGSEQHTRRIAERLVDKYDVTVLTSTALKENWEPYYEEGTQWLNGVKIRRFNREKRSGTRSLQAIRKDLEAAGPGGAGEKLVKEWIETMGPYCPALIRYIRDNRDQFEAFFFSTYLFYHTVAGLPLVKEKAIFLPTAHDETPIYLYDVYKHAFCGPKDFLFNAPEEQQLVHRLYRNESIRSMVVGEGVDTPETVDPEGFRQRMGLGEYIVYVGRPKMSAVLINYFLRFKAAHPGELKLVLVGRHDDAKKYGGDVVYTGFVSDQEKFDAMAGAKCLVMPSQFESLCMAVLEALSVGTPVIVNGKCAVLRGHCHRGNCGLYYTDYDEFEGCLSYMLENEQVRRQMGEKGKQYVQANYSWSVTTDRIDEIMKDYE